MQEKFGNLIKEIRKEYNLTQKDIADKYHVTYQAVSKWENGKNMPDVSILKEISKDFNVSVHDLIDGNIKKKKKKNIYIILLIVICTIFVIGIILLIKRDNNFESKTLSSTCKDYNISGIISYNSNKSVIYIPKIEYCGNNTTTKYKKIECTLYEKNNDIIKKISSYDYSDKEITLDEFMKLVSFNVDNYSKVCKDFNNDSIYLEIKAYDSLDEIYYHTVNLTLDDKCS